MFKSVISRVQAELDQQNRGQQDNLSVIQQQIEMYEEALQAQTDAFAATSQHPSYRKSFETILELYKSGKLDGTKTTYVCSGKVIEVKDIEDMPEYTIVDLPYASQNHFETGIETPS